MATDVRDPRQLRIALRKDLRITIETTGGQPCYTIEDPVDVRFFQVGMAEGAFLALLDGKTTLDVAVRRAAMMLRERAFTEQEALALVHWLVETGLAELRPGAGELTSDWSREKRRWPDPLAVRLPLLRPGSFLTSLTAWFGWLFSGPMGLVWSVLVASAAARLLWHQAEFWEAATSTITASRWWSFLLAYLLLKLIHESAHAIVCTKHGGRVPEAGIMLLWGFPVPYVDVTAAWSFPSRWPRIHTAAAGLYIEMLVAALAALLWQPDQAGAASRLCVEIILCVVVGSLAFNLNPLMRFDGYYMLMDLVGIPNLAMRGSRFWTDRVAKYLWGATVVLQREPPWQKQIIACYGLLAAAWRGIVYLTLALITCSLLPIHEDTAPAAALLLIAGLMALQRLGQLPRRTPRLGANRLRMAATTIALVLVAWWALWSAPWPGRYRAHGIVQHAPLHVVRSHLPGRVVQVHVRGGQEVEQGQLLATMVSEPLAVEVADLEVALQQTELAIRSTQYHRASAAQKGEQRNQKRLEQRLAEKRAQLDRLVVRAPASGTVLTRHIDRLVDRHVQAGGELMVIGSGQQKELQVAVLQDDVELFTPYVGHDMQVRVGGQRLEGRLERLSPRASIWPPHPALCATGGGPLAVQTAEYSGSAAGQQTVRLVAPHFTATIGLHEADANRLGAGQRCQVMVAAPHKQLAAHLLATLRRWCRDHLRAARR